jgi:serine O-acetyltransferase
MLSTVAKDLSANGCRRGILSALVCLGTCPGFLAITLHRVASKLHRGGGFVGRALAKLVWRINVLSTGCHFSPKATIGRGIHLPHPVGIVIGDGAVIGEGVSIYQGVTIGVSRPGARTYPIVGNGATLYAGSVIAGDIRIGEDAIIGANAFVNIDVPSSGTAYGIPARLALQGTRG